MSDFWKTLAANPSSQLLMGSMDSLLSGRAVGEDFERVRTLTDVHREAHALSLPVEAGTKVSFIGTLGAYMGYDNPPPEGSVGEVVNVKSANGDVTYHEGKVFVQWDDGEFRPIHAEHLRLASGKTASDLKVARDEFRAGDKVTKKERPRGPLRGGGVGTVVSYNNRTKEVLVDWGNQRVGYETANKLEKKAQSLTADLKAQFEKIKALAKKKPNNKFLDSVLEQLSEGHTLTEKQLKVVEEIQAEVKEMASMKKQLKTLEKSQKASFRVASLGDLTDFLKVSEETLVHKSTKDLWSVAAEGDDFVITRLFDDEGAPLKG